jgi:DNA polymerase V
MLRDMSNVAALYSAPDVPSALTRPLYLALVAAGFPSPADDHLDRDLDLHELLIQHPASTFYSACPVIRCRAPGCTTATS